MKFNALMKECCRSTAIIILLAALVLIGAGIAVFVQFSNALSGGLASFLAVGGILFEYGFLLFAFGAMVITSMNVYAKYEGFWTGKKFNLVCIVVNFALIVYSADVVYEAYDYYSKETTAVDELRATDDSSSVGFVRGEGLAGHYFNTLFFDAANKLSSQWLWSWVDKNCPSTMSLTYCQRCYSYTLSFCPANQQLCQQPTDNYCPYTLCRESALDFFATKLVWSVMVVAAVLFVTHFILGVFLCLLFCSTLKDKAVLKVVPLPELERGHIAENIDYEDEVLRALTAEDGKEPGAYVVESFEQPPMLISPTIEEEAVF